MLELDVDALAPLLIEKMQEHEIIEAAKKLKQIFIERKDKWTDYSNDRKLVSAYSLVYMTTNIPKLEFAFNQLPIDTLEKLKETCFIDIGCGPGTYSLAWMNYFKTGHVHLVDHSQAMLEQAENFVDHFFPGASIASLEGKKRTLFFGNSLNEMAPELCLEMVNKFKPEFVILLEPGTKESFKKVCQVRTKMIESGWHISYPCPSGAVNCPLEDKSDWCHQVLRTTHSPSVERLCQILRLDRRTLPMVCHIFHKNAVQRKQGARTIQKLSETKFSFNWRVCRESEGSNQEDKIELLKKGYSTQEKKREAKRDTGTWIDFEIEKELSDGTIRVRNKKI